ncbi:MAG: arginine--tRNA ligase [Monoglobales bacterium]
MNNMISEITKQIKTTVSDAIAGFLNDKGIETECPDFVVEKPREKAHGDFAVNAAMMLARPAKMAPAAIAGELCSRMNFDGTYIEKAETAGPGFINFTLKKDYLFDAIRLAEEMGGDYGKQNIGNGKKVMVEFVSANPTGPMHMGNARGGALGDSLASVLSLCGYDVTREFYLNDAGAQIDKLKKSLEARYLQLMLGEDAVEFPEDGYHGSDIITHMKNFIAEHPESYVDVPSEERREVFAEYALKKNIEGLKTGLENYGIKYDVWFKETSLYENGDVDETIELLKKSGKTYEKDGALWLKSTDFGLDKDDVLVRENGFPTYFAVDIAYHRNKFLVRGFDKVINIWGADHHGHVARMKAAMEAIGVAPDKLDVILMQLVRLVKEGKPVKMSKRTGEMITLSDLIEDIGLDATRFFFNLRAADSHFDFDLDLAAEQSSDNPVFYVQYAHARICSILRRLGEEGITPLPCNSINLSLLTADEEINLMEVLASYPEEIRLAAEHFDPTGLTRYTCELASAFHSFYNACHVRIDDKELMQARLKLTLTVKNTLSLALSVLGVSAPEKM